MPCSVVDSTCVFEKPVVPVFSAEDEGIRFMQDVDTCLPKFIMSPRAPWSFLCSFCMLQIKLDFDFLCSCMSDSSELLLLIGIVTSM